MLEDYWQLMPQYQGISSMDDLEVLRILFGFFPTYRESPLRPGWDRTLQVVHLKELALHLLLAAHMPCLSCLHLNSECCNMLWCRVSSQHACTMG